MPGPSPLLHWARRLAAIAQSGLTFSPGLFDRDRYQQVRRLAAEIAAHPTGDVEEVHALFAGHVGYATPKIICRAAVFDSEDRILMVREVLDGLWTLPGGWIDVGDTPAGAAEREVREESGYLVRARKLAAVYDKDRHPHPPVPDHSFLMFFVCELVGGEAATSIETTDVGWFPRDALPELSKARTLASQIDRMFEHHLHPELPTDFD